MPHTVLVVEDELIVRMTIAEFLRDEGYEVIEAGTADQALTLLNNDAKIDVLFSDVRMPGSINGCELARHVRAQWPAVPVILTSGYSDELLTARSVSEDFVIPKPYRPEAIVTAIKAVLLSVYH